MRKNNILDETKNEVIMTKKLIENKILLKFVWLEPKDAIKQLKKDIQQVLGKSPPIQIVGKINDDTPIFAFKDEINGILSYVGWTIKRDEIKNENIYNLIDLNDCLYK